MKKNVKLNFKFKGSQTCYKGKHKVEEEQESILIQTYTQ